MLTLGSHSLSTGCLFSLQSLTLQGDHRNSAQGLHSLLSSQGHNELIKSLRKIGIIG